MGHWKKTSADFKNEINDLVESLGVGGDTRVQDSFKAYEKLENKKDKGRTSLTKEETAFQFIARWLFDWPTVALFGEATPEVQEEWK